MLTIKVPGADTGTNNIGRTQLLTSKRTGLVGEYLIGVNAANSVYNSANPAKPLTIVGAPTFNADHAVCAAANWFDTGLYDSPDLTWLVVADGVTSGATLMGNYTGSNPTVSTLLYHNATAFVTMQGSASDASVNTFNTVKVTPTANFRAVAGRAAAGLDFTLKVDQYAAGVLTSAAINTATGKTRTTNAVTALSIGSPRGHATLGGSIKIAAALVWTVRLTDAELLLAFQEMTAQIKGLRGLTV